MQHKEANRQTLTLLQTPQARARDLFYGLWTNDLFMRRVEANAEWSLFCLNEAPGHLPNPNPGSKRLQARARDLFYGLWTNDLFMRRVEANAEWSLFCPNEAPGLAETWGPEFDALYARYEREGRAKKVIKAQQLWFAILEAQARPNPVSALVPSDAGHRSQPRSSFVLW